MLEAFALFILQIHSCARSKSQVPGYLFLNSILLRTVQLNEFVCVCLLFVKSLSHSVPLVAIPSPNVS